MFQFDLKSIYPGRDQNNIKNLNHALTTPKPHDLCWVSMDRTDGATS
jgi:hypothetical protein